MENSCPSLTNNQWDLSESTVKLLQPFEEVTNVISAEKSTIADIIPALVCIRKCLAQTGDSYGIGSFKEALEKGLEERCKNLVFNKNYSIATFIDPRYKNVFFNTSEKKSIISIVIKEITSISRLTGGSDSETNNSDDEPLIKKKKASNETSTLWQCFEDIANSSKENKNCDVKKSITDEIGEYLQKPILDRNSCPLEFWKTQNKNFPYIFKLVPKFLLCPGTSVPSERLFSEMRNIFEDKRSSLDPEMAEKIVFIHENV